VTAAALVSIAVTPTNPSTPLGVNVNFVATGTYTDASTQDITTQVTWFSDTTSTATVSNAGGSEGEATPLAVGSTVISASLSTINSNDSGESSTLTVTAAVLASIAVSPIDPTTPLGVSVNFTATGTYTDASTQDITTQVTWFSDATSTATISNAGGSEGEASPVTVGTTVISATLDSINSNDTGESSTLTVTDAALLSISVTPVNPTTPLGVDVSFTATGTYTDASTQDITTQVTWFSDTTSTATISNAGGSEGEASPVTVGTTVISASLTGISSDDSGGSSTLTVSNAVLVSIAVTPVTDSIIVSATTQFTATGTYSDSTKMDITTAVTWSSSNNTVATIDNTTNIGLATGVSAGAVTIDATDSGTGISASDTAEDASLDIL